MVAYFLDVTVGRTETDSSLGRSLMITPRSVAEQGFVDTDREDYKDAAGEEYMRKTQAAQLVIIEDRWLDDYKVRTYKD